MKPTGKDVVYIDGYVRNDEAFVIAQAFNGNASLLRNAIERIAILEKMEEASMKDEDLKKLEAQIEQMMNALSDMVQKMHEHFMPLYDAVDKATALIEAQIADKPSCENCLYHDTEAGTDICKYWDEVPPAYTPCCKHKFKNPKEG